MYLMVWFSCLVLLMVLSHNQKLTGDLLINIRVPRIGFVNKMDRQGSNFLMVCQQVRDMLKSNAVAITLPIGEENDFKGVVDLVKNQAIVWHEEGLGATYDIVPIPEDMLAEVKEYRSILIEAVADYDENLLEKFMEDEESITEEEINIALRAAVMDMAIIPMIAGSSFKNKGVQFMLMQYVNTCHLQWIKRVSKGFILMMLNC